MSHTELAKYPTDLTDEQWQILRKLLPQSSRRGAPRTVCRRAVVNAILYLLRSGCAWRLLPREFPKWKIVYGIFLHWRTDGTWQKIHDTLHDMLRRCAGARGRPVRRSSTVRLSRRPRSAASGVTTPVRKSMDASVILLSTRSG